MYQGTLHFDVAVFLGVAQQHKESKIYISNVLKLESLRILSGWFKFRHIIKMKQSSAR